MLSVLILSNEDKCRSRIAQKLLTEFGRGMVLTTAGLSDGGEVPEVVIEAMAEEGYSLSRRKSVAVNRFKNQKWGVIITLSSETKKYLIENPIESRYSAHFEFSDVLSSSKSVEEVMENLEFLYENMYRMLYRYYRDFLSDLVLPVCTCGANTYCRCE